jgi:hypothetical protein
MSVTLNANYIAELTAGQNEPVTIIEIEFDSGTLKFSSDSVFGDVLVGLGAVTSAQNKLDTEKGYATRGNISFQIIGRDNFKSLIKNEYPKNRRVSRYDGFVGLAFSDYVKTFTGTIQDWKRNADTLTFTVEDDAQKITQKIPVEDGTGTQVINYMNYNPVDIMTDMLEAQLGIDGSLIDTAQFESERDLWRNAWKFHRVLIEPREGNKYLNELQEQTFSYIFSDGQKISYKADEPPVPASTVIVYSDDDNILEDTLNAESGYKKNFYNRIEVWYDHDESGSDNRGNYETVQIVSNVDSQSASEWDETKIKVVKSKWLRTYQWSQPVNVTGITIYHTSKDNGLSAGATGSTLLYTQSTNSLQWTAPDGVAGSVVVLDSDGVYQVFDQNLNKYIRISVDISALPVSTQSDTIDITDGAGSTYSSILANKIMSKYRDPATSVSFSVSINNINNDSNFLKVADTVKMTTDGAFDFGRDSWIEEQMLITSVRPNFTTNKVAITAIQKRAGSTAGLRSSFIAPSGQPDYGSATEAQKEYAFIGAAGTNLVGGTDNGYYII